MKKNVEEDKNERTIFKLVKKLSLHLPKFDDGRIDYTKAPKAPVLICFVSYNNKILLLKRSNKVLVYRGMWSTVAGFIDELKPIREKILEELSEELKIGPDIIKSIKIGDSYEIVDKKVKRIWIRVPVLVVLNKKSNIILDFEHTEYKWINPEEINLYKTPPQTLESLKRVFN